MTYVIERISQLAAEKQITPYELINIADISNAAVYDWLAGKAEPTLKSVIKICEALHVSLERFFCESDFLRERDMICVKWSRLTDDDRTFVLRLIGALKRAGS